MLEMKSRNMQCLRLTLAILKSIERKGMPEGLKRREGMTLVLYGARDECHELC